MLMTFLQQVAKSLSLSGGVDDYAVGISGVQTALNLFLDVENITIDFVLAGGSITSWCSSWCRHCY